MRESEREKQRETERNREKQSERETTDAITHRSAHTCWFCCQTRTTTVTSARIIPPDNRSAPCRFTSATSSAPWCPFYLQGTTRTSSLHHSTPLPLRPAACDTHTRPHHRSASSSSSSSSLSVTIPLQKCGHTGSCWARPPRMSECERQRREKRDSPSNERSFFQRSCRQGASPRSQVFLVPNMTAGQSRALDRWTGCKGRQGGPHPQHR